MNTLFKTRRVFRDPQTYNTYETSFTFRWQDVIAVEAYAFDDLFEEFETKCVVHLTWEHGIILLEDLAAMNARWAQYIEEQSFKYGQLKKN